jgi:hypothetical protein
LSFSRIRRVASLLAILLTVACAGKTSQDAGSQTSASQPDSTPLAAAGNLLAFSRGAVVIDRTGELALSSSPVYAVDALDRSVWITPPKDPDHTVIVALPVRSRVDRIGLSTGFLPEGARPPKQVIFEGSSDGSTFNPIATLEVPERKNEQMVDAGGRELTHVRVTIADGTTDVVAVGSILAAGSEVAPYSRPSIAGEWEVNGLAARFGQSGARVWGEIAMEPPMKLEGGWHDRMIRFIYLRGKEFGYGAIVVSPDGQSLNARLWYEEVIPLFEAVPQFGRRTGDASPPATWNVTEGWLERFRRVPLYAIRFDESGAIDAAASGDTLQWLARRGKVGSILKREYSAETAEENLTRSRTQLEALKRALAERGGGLSATRFEALGTTQYKESPATAVERPLYSRVEVTLP